MMREFIGAASGAYDPCANAKGPCMIDSDLPRVVLGTLEQCGKINPWAMMKAWECNNANRTINDS